MAAQPLTALGPSTEAKQSVSGNSAAPRETGSTFSATLSQQRAHHQPSNASARNETADAGSSRPSDPDNPQDKEHAHNREKNKSDDKDKNVADRSVADRDNTQDNAAGANQAAPGGQQVAPEGLPRHEPLPANSAKTSNPDINDRGDHQTRKALHSGNAHEHLSRHEIAEHRAILKIGARSGNHHTTGEKHSVTHDRVNQMGNRAHQSRPRTSIDVITSKGHADIKDSLRANALTSTDVTTAKGHTDSKEYLRTNAFSKPLPFSETISDAKTFNERIIQRLATERADVTATVNRAAKTIDGTASTGALVQGTPLHMMPAGGSQSAPTSISPATTAGTALTGGINAPFGSDQWQQALTRQSLRLSHSGGGHARLTLHPPSLGTLHVSLQLGDHAQIHFSSPHAEVRAAVNSALPQLKNAFVDAGIDLGQTFVSDNSQQFDTRQGDHRDQNNPDRANNSVEEVSEADATMMQITRSTGRALSGGVDIFA